MSSAWARACVGGGEPDTSTFGDDGWLKRAWLAVVSSVSWVRHTGEITPRRSCELGSRCEDTTIAAPTHVAAPRLRHASPLARAAPPRRTRASTNFATTVFRERIAGFESARGCWRLSCRPGRPRRPGASTRRRRCTAAPQNASVQKSYPAGLRPDDVGSFQLLVRAARARRRLGAAVRLEPGDARARSSRCACTATGVSAWKSGWWRRHRVAPLFQVLRQPPETKVSCSARPRGTTLWRRIDRSPPRTPAAAVPRRIRATGGWAGNTRARPPLLTSRRRCRNGDHHGVCGTDGFVEPFRGDRPRRRRRRPRRRRCRGRRRALARGGV